VSENSEINGHAQQQKFMKML